MKKTIKTLILEFVSDRLTGHIKEIHLAISELRPNVPQHTVRARLSELARSENLEEKLSAFGSGFYGLYEEDRNLCSIASYPDRGPWGDPKFRGNCSGHLVKNLILRFRCESVFDPAHGSGTVKSVVNGINRFKGKNIQYAGCDLKEGWDILKGRLPEHKFDLVWFHPPYWDIIRYSDDPRDLSTCCSLAEFEEKLNMCCERLMQAVRPGGILAVLVGDKRKNGRYYALHRTLLMNPRLGRLKSIIIKVQHNCQSYRKAYGSENPYLIPIRHEYCLLFEKQEAQSLSRSLVEQTHLSSSSVNSVEK